jgi:hypothetical protein
MGAAGHFVNSLETDDKEWKKLRHYLRDTNLDVIAAAAMVWIAFVIAQL